MRFLSENASPFVQAVSACYVVHFSAFSPSPCHSLHMTSYEILFLGTSARRIPDIKCLTTGKPCHTCSSAQKPGSKDHREETFVALKVTKADGEKSTILFDLPMDFYHSACNMFPSHK